MQGPQNISIEDYNYDLPDDRIAKYPLSNRDQSKLLVYRNGHIETDVFKNIGNWLSEQCMLVFNNTRVIRARLYFRKETGARIEIFCLEPHDPADYNLSFQAKKEVVWRCMVGNLKKWKAGQVFLQLETSEGAVNLSAEKMTQEGADVIVRFRWDEDFTFSELLELSGELPIPPYLNRETEENDLESYQTVYSKIKGSVAAPTAGLHFTNDILEQLTAKKVKMNEVTLHVGAGTFHPVKAEKMADHPMHSELIEVSRALIEDLLQHKGSVVPVGTTSVRTLESLYWLGVAAPENKWKQMPHVNQWDAYGNDKQISRAESLQNLLNYMRSENIDYIRASTQIIIAPGYEFKMIDGMITNFHQPKSTLLLLVSALVGENWKTIYDYALQNDFRFLSYGDSSILFKHSNKII